MTSLSGSGTLHCLDRFAELSYGSMRVAGGNVGRKGPHDLREFRGRVSGMMFQHLALFLHRMISGSVESGPEVHRTSAAKYRARATQAIHLVGPSGWERGTPG